MLSNESIYIGFWILDFGNTKGNWEIFIRVKLHKMV